MHGTATAAGSGTAPAATPSDTHSTIELVVAGISQPLIADDEIPITADVRGTIAIDRGASDKRYSRSLELRLFHTDDQPIDDAAVQLTAHMRDMDGGTFRESATVAGGGRYALPLAFPMPGEWQVDLEIQRPGMPVQTLQVTMTLLG